MRKAPDNNSTGLFRWRTSAFVAVGLLLIAVFAFCLYENLPRQSRIVIPNAPPKSAGSEEPWPEILEREKREAKQQQQRLGELRRKGAGTEEEESQARVATEAEAKRQEAELQRQSAAKAQEERVAA